MMWMMLRQDEPDDDVVATNTPVAMLVEHDMELAARQKTLREAGHAAPEFSGHDQ